MLYLRPTSILAYEECGYEYFLKEVRRIREEVVGHALPFGTCIHRACLAYVKAHALDQEIDPVPIFEKEWANAMATTIIDFNTRHDAEALTAIGVLLTKLFPQTWKDLKLKAVVTPAGDVLVEQRLKIKIDNQVVLSGESDIVARSMVTNEIGVVDLKSPGSAFWEGFADASDQLTAYQKLVETHAARLGLTEKVSFVAFLEGVKAKDASWHWQQAKARSPERIDEYLVKVLAIAKDILSGRFMRRSAAAYNSPCSMCGFRKGCHFNDWEGLQVSDSQSFSSAA